MRARRPLLARVFSGGADGNEQLTAVTGVVLIVLLAALGVTILRIGQMLNAHMFLGMLLLGPVALKIGEHRLPLRALLHRRTAPTASRARLRSRCACSLRSSSR